MAATGLRYLGYGHPPLHRFRLGLEFVLSGRREVDGMIEHHGAIARMLGEQLGLPSRCLPHSARRTSAGTGAGGPAT